MAFRKKTKNCFSRLSLNAGHKYCRMLPLEHSAILLTFIQRPVVIKTFVFVFFLVAVLHRFYCRDNITQNQSDNTFNILFVIILDSVRHKLEDLMVLKRSPDLLNNVKIGQDQLQLIMKHILFYGSCGHFGQVT